MWFSYDMTDRFEVDFLDLLAKHCKHFENYEWQKNTKH